VGDLPPNASYTVCVAADGFQSTCVAGDVVTVDPGAAVTQDFALATLLSSSSVSRPSALDGWFGDTPDTAEPGYVVNPSYQPEAGHDGLGSLSLDISDQPASSWWHLTGDDGLPLSAVSEVGFAQSGSGVATYQLVLCDTTSDDHAAAENGCDNYARIVWNAPAASDGWTSVSADLTTAQWWSTRDLTGLAKNGPTATLAQIVANNPDARVIWYGVFRGATSGSTTTDQVLVDDVDFNGAVTDFEPDVATVTVTATNTDQDLSPLASVSMTVKTTDGAVLYSVSDDTDSVSGDTASITAPNVPVGSYQVCISGTDEAGHALAPTDGNACTTVDVTLDGENSFSVDLAQVRGSISGTVTAAGSDGPIQGVTVTVKDGTTTVGTATTDVDGTYSVTDLLAGTYDVVFTDAPAYLPLTKSDVSVEQGADTTVDAALTEAPGSISGSVTALDGGAPLAGVTVTVKDGDTTVGTATTGADGDYTVTGVPAGTYDVVFTDAPTYVSTTVPDVTVAQGVETPDVDATLALADGTVTGTVADADGAGLAGVLVTAYDAASGAMVGDSATTDADGGYTIAVPAGEYVLCFDASEASGGGSASGYVSVCGVAVTVESGVPATVDQTLQAARPAVTCDADLFVDVAATNPFCADITWLAGTGITQGVDDTHYAPGQDVTRGQMAIFLFRLANPGEAAPVCTVKPFDDVPANAISCGPIKWLVAAGVANGVDATHFAPQAKVTRGQMALFLYRLVHGGSNAPACTEAPFSDVAVNSLACGAIAWLADTGITTGTAQGLFSPANSVTRGQMAAFLHRLADLTEITGTVEADSGPLSGVSVVINGTGDTDAAYSTVTDEDGGYAVQDLQPGTYTVCFDGSGVAGAPDGGYAFECFDDEIGDATPDTVTVQPWMPQTVDAELAAPES
jgi:hypothetical protein